MPPLQTPAAPTSHRLSLEEVRRFHRDGFLGPITMMSPEEMAPIRAQIEQQVLEVDSPLSKSRVQSRHLDVPVVMDLCSHPAIVERVVSIFGPDVILWRSHFFNKGPGDLAVPWHQDINYWPIQPTLNVSAWLAIDRVTEENSCVQLIPGSHRQTVPHLKSEGTMFGEEADPDYFDASQAIKMELEPGQFFLFTERLLHHSAPNTSDQRRLGLAVRMTVPMVMVDHEKLFKGHHNIVLSGEDRFGLNQIGERPAGSRR